MSRWQKPHIYPKGYVRYWSQFGEYGLERVRRMRERKKKRGMKLLCRCGQNPKSSPHTCPFNEDMNGDYVTLCRCCSDCMANCAGDI